MSTELEQRLRRLAADVDLDKGRAEQSARQARRARTAGRRRVLIGACAAAALAIVVAATGLALRDRSSGDGDGNDVIIDPETSVETASAVQDGIEVAVAAPTEATAGTRLWFDVVVRNEGDAAVYWNAGGCTIPVTAAVGPSSTVGSGPRWPGPDAARWDGDVGTLGAWLAEHNTLSTTQPHQSADLTGVREISCEDDLVPEPLEPGSELRHRGSVELRVPPGDLPDGGHYELVVAFRSSPDIEVVDEALSSVEVRASVTVTDDSRRTAEGSGAAVDAFAADPRLAGWIASTEVPGRPDLVQDFGTELSWWRGAWELWTDAHWDGDHPLRMRYDPASGEVVDVRTVSQSQAPGDEPGRASVAGEEPDEVL